MAGPLRQYQAVSSAFAGFVDVLDDLLKSVVVSDEVAVDGRHAARRLGTRITVVGVPGGMHAQNRVRHGSIHRDEGVSGRPGDRVPDRAELEADEVAELVESGVAV